MGLEAAPSLREDGSGVSKLPATNLGAAKPRGPESRPSPGVPSPVDSFFQSAQFYQGLPRGKQDSVSMATGLFGVAGRGVWEEFDLRVSQLIRSLQGDLGQVLSLLGVSLPYL